MNKTHVILALILLAASTTMARAAGDDDAIASPTAGRIDEQQSSQGFPTAAPAPQPPLVPERDTRFLMMEEPSELELFAADPQLLQQRYVAQITVVFNDRDFPDIPPGGIEVLSSELQGASHYMDVFLFRPNTSILRGHMRLSGAEYFRQLTGLVPQEQLPPQAVTQLLTSADSEVKYLSLLTVRSD